MKPSILQVRVRELAASPPLLGLCAGYEQGRWRAEELARQLIRLLPEFALSIEDRMAIDDETAVELVAKAALVIYETEKYSSRGELGELLLHAVIRQEFETIPAVSKLFYKDGPNETVKGFDAVHVVASGDKLQLWLGEAKFYKDIGDAVDEVISEIKAHLRRKYLSSEFLAITNKLSPLHPHYERLKLLLDPNTSLDEVFDCLCIPVLLTYESPTVRTAGRVTESFSAALQDELKTHHATFARKLPALDIEVKLMLFPMHTKADLVDAFHRRLRAAQSLA